MDDETLRLVRSARNLLVGAQKALERVAKQAKSKTLQAEAQKQANQIYATQLQVEMLLPSESERGIF